MRELIAAIRQDPKVGSGSCSVVDECYGDQEILDALTEQKIETVEGALKWAYVIEGLFLEQALNTRWGEDDDPQLKQWQEWNKETGDGQ